jgi:hypothetical protein
LDEDINYVVTCVPSCPFVSSENATEIVWFTEYDKYVGNYAISLVATVPNGYDSPPVEFNLELTSQCADGYRIIYDTPAIPLI